MWLVTLGFCPCTITKLLMTTAISVLFIMFWEVLVSSKLLIAYQSYVQSSSCSLSSLSSAFFRQSSTLNLIFYSRVPKFFCSGAFLTVTVFLCAISSVIRGHLLFRSSSFHLGISGPFNNRWYSLSFAAHRRLLSSPYCVGFYVWW